jgi:hypothetical protein
LGTQRLSGTNEVWRNQKTEAALIANRAINSNPRPYCSPVISLTRGEVDKGFYVIMLADEIDTQKAWWSWKIVRVFGKF